MQSLVGFRILPHYSGTTSKNFRILEFLIWGDKGSYKGFKKGGGGLYSAGLITGLKQHFKTNSSADQNTSCIHSRFYASKRCKKSIQYKLEGGLCSAGLITRCTFSLQVDRGLISGAGGGGWGGGI